jgi:hypothetical protein
MLSDNAHIFTKTAFDLKSISANENVLTSLNSINVDWKFIPVNAPHFGGAWERMIGLTKGSLRKVLGRSMISSIELSTILCEIESLINDRPLTYVSDDVGDNPLTPSHLLCGRRIRALANNGVDLELLTDPDYASKNLFTRRYLRVRKLLDVFWARWKSEYLTSLRERHCNVNNSNPSLRPGSVVLICNKDNRNNWKLGRIVELNIGSDGIVRSALLKTKNGLTSHPIINLVNLEVHDDLIVNVDLNNKVADVCDREKRKAAVEANKRIAACF